MEQGGKIALDTGATRGIGRGTALELCRAGARVYAVGRTREEGGHPLPGSLASLVAEARGCAGDIVPLACDLRDDAAQLREYGVAVVSIWPYFVRTERMGALDADAWSHDMQGAESQRFTGRGIVALAGDPQVLSRSGRALTSKQLALDYGFEDVGGGLPDGPISTVE